MWPLLDAFFTHQMPKQTPIAGALEALADLSEIADIVILTNVGPEHQARRVEQLASHGLFAPVVGSRGGKGDPVARLVAEYAPSVAVFIDDLAQHHTSVAEHAPDVWRLHMVGEPAISDKIKPSRHAHARIDRWADAHDWIAARLLAGLPAPSIETV